MNRYEIALGKKPVWPTIKYRRQAFVGGPGCGKTRRLIDEAFNIRSHYPEALIGFTTPTRFLNELDRTLQRYGRGLDIFSGRWEEFKNYKLGVLLIDNFECFYDGDHEEVVTPYLEKDFGHLSIILTAGLRGPAHWDTFLMESRKNNISMGYRPPAVLSYLPPASGVSVAPPPLPPSDFNYKMNHQLFSRNYQNLTEE